MKNELIINMHKNINKKTIILNYNNVILDKITILNISGNLLIQTDQNSSV